MRLDTLDHEKIGTSVAACYCDWRLRLDTLDHEKIGTSVAACYCDWRLRLDTLARCGSTLAACPWPAPRGSSPPAESAWVVLVANVNVRKL